MREGATLHRVTWAEVYWCWDPSSCEEWIQEQVDVRSDPSCFSEVLRIPGAAAVDADGIAAIADAGETRSQVMDRAGTWPDEPAAAS